MKLLTVAEMAVEFDMTAKALSYKLNKLGIKHVSYSYPHIKKVRLFDFEEVKAKINCQIWSELLQINANTKQQIIPVSDSFVRLDKWIANIKQSN